MNITRRKALSGISLAATLGATGGALAVIQPSTPPTPQERISAALADIQAAMRDAYPGWHFQTESRVICPELYVSGGPNKMLAPSRHFVMAYAYEERYGPEVAKVWIDYPELRAGGRS